MNSPYYKFSHFLKQRYGEKVWKICVDAGFSCPNRNPENNSNGCIFCRVDSFSKMQSRQNIDVVEQIDNGIRLAQERFQIQKYIVYFQASTNTYAPLPVLRQLFKNATRHKGVVGLSIATRPDCLPPGVMDLLSEIASETDLWIELGLQSIHDSTLTRINRGHTFKTYTKALTLLKFLPLRICTHVMIGLPGEGHKDIMATADEIAHSGIDEVKIHPLLILRDTSLAKMYNNNKTDVLSLEKYAEWVCDFIERLPPNMVIQRLTAEAPENILIEPRWTLNKHQVFQKVEEKFRKRKSKQGQLFQA